MQHFLFSSPLGGQSVAEPEGSKEKVRVCPQTEGNFYHDPLSVQMQNITETLCPRFHEGKLILQEIIQSLTPSRHCKKMTQALAEQAVEVTSHISRLLDGAEETPQLHHNMFQLEQYGDFFLLSTAHSPDGKARTLRDISLFVQSETKQNVLFRMLFAKSLHLRSLSLDRRLIGLLKPFEVFTVASIFPRTWSYSLFFSKVLRRLLY